MAKVFISYSRKDIEFAKRLTGELQKSDLEYWIDWEGIPPTVDWWREIEKGIEESDAFLFLISPDSVYSEVCGQEIEYAFKNGKRLIPLVIRETNGNGISQQLKSLNWIFFREEDDFATSITKLLTSIRTDYNWVQAHRRLQVKALEWERNQNENSFLLRGKDLGDAELQLATNSSKEPYPTDLQREYVFESRRAEDMQRRSSLRRRNIVAIIGIVLLITIVLAVTGQLNRFIYRPVDMEDYWVTIPAGEFQMGSENGDENDKPVYSVYLKSYQIGKYETTNRQYAQCVKARFCGGGPSFTEDKALHPVVNVTWYDAVTYCEWVGGRLPTEAEWEKAASWNDKTKTKYVYPWGNDVPTANLLNSDFNVGNTTSVGRYVTGASPYGLYDMAGNVWEWVNDWYDGTYYQNSPTSNPSGPESGQSRVIRGGSWYGDNYYVRSTYRGARDIPTNSNSYVGFRCSRSP